jgi:hypothetical protein
VEKRAKEEAMRLRRKLVLGMTALLAAVPLTVVPSASADVSVQSCRENIDVTNPTGGARVIADLCWDSTGDGWYWMRWTGTVQDKALDDSGAVAQVKFTIPRGVASIAYRADGSGATASINDGDYLGKGLYIRACLINGDSVHACSAWK